MTSHDQDQHDRKLDDLLGELARRDRQDRPSARVEHAVMARWAADAARRDVVHVETLAPRQLAMRSTWRVAGVAFVVSAAAAWAFATLVDRPRTDPAPVVATGTSASRGPSSEAPAPSRAPDGHREGLIATQPDAEPVAARVATPRSTPQPDEEPMPAPSPDTRSFVALSPVAAQDLGSVRVMRVQLSGAAVRTLGLDLPAPAVQQDGFVQADVLLGEDGMARAIRLLP